MARISSNLLPALRAYNGQILWARSDLFGRVHAYSKGVVCDNRMVDGETGDPSLDKTIPLPKGTVYWSAVADDIYYAVVTDGGKNTLFAYNLINNSTVYTITGFDDNNALPDSGADKLFSLKTFDDTTEPAQPAVKPNEPTKPGDNDLPNPPTSKVPYDVLTIVMAGGKLYSYSGQSVYCHNLSDGSKIWGPVNAPEAIEHLRASDSGVIVQSGLEPFQSFFFICC